MPGYPFDELDGYDEEFLKEEQEKIMVKRYGKPEEVAYLVKFFISDEANFINNSILHHSHQVHFLYQ